MPPVSLLSSAALVPVLASLLDPLLDPELEPSTSVVVDIDVVESSAVVVGVVSPADNDRPPESGSCVFASPKHALSTLNIITHGRFIIGFLAGFR